MKPEEVADNVGKFMYKGEIVVARPLNTPVVSSSFIRREDADGQDQEGELR